MTKEEQIAEHESTSVFVPHSYESINAPPPPPSTYHPTATNDSPPPLINKPLQLHTSTASSCDPNYLTIPGLPTPQPLNFSGGIAASCLDKIVQHSDLMGARERIKRERQEGKTLIEKIKAQKGRFSAGKSYNANIVRIGETFLELLVGT